MKYRTLGRTGLRVSRLAFGAGPISGLMCDGPNAEQTATIRRALELGVNWFDTAATYGQGNSESALGHALRVLGATDVHVATKVRLEAEDLVDVGKAIRTSVCESLERLGRPSCTLLQLHNAVTVARGDEPTSLAVDDILEEEGVLATFRELQREGLVRFLGLTGLGDPHSLKQLIRTGAFDTIQTPYNLVNPSAGQPAPPGFKEANYGNLFVDCAAQAMGVFTIRVFAAGALLGAAPSPHTFKTRFFPLDLYRRDLERAQRLATQLPANVSMKEAAICYSLSHPAVTAAIVGCGSPEEVAENCGLAAAATNAPAWLSELSPGGGE